jgi:acetyltransferase-like isoleucine patch superfamily enzyme
VGAHSYIQKNSLLMAVDMGKYCSIAMNVYIGLPQHELRMVSTHPAFYLRDTPLVKTYCEINLVSAAARTVIGHDVWIGQGSLVMAGVVIGNGAVIGAGSIVTKDVPDYAIVAGSPATLIRYRFADDVRQQLLNTRWYDMPEEWIKKHSPMFIEPAVLLAQLELPQK